MQTVTVPVFHKGQRLRHVPDGAQGRFCRYHPWRPGWVIVRMPGRYTMHTLGIEWEPYSPLLDDKREL